MEDYYSYLKAMKYMSRKKKLFEENISNINNNNHNEKNINTYVDL